MPLSIEQISKKKIALGWPAGQLPSGQYVTSVNVANGVITVTYGNLANPAILNDTLLLTPGVSPSGDVVWVCQNAPTPAGATMSVAPAAGSIEGKYTSATCRP